MKKLSSQEVKVLLDKAEQNFRSGSPSAAASLLDRILVSDPKNAKANELLGYIHAKQGDFARALKRLKVASAQDGCTAYCLYYLGLCLIRLGFYEDAEAPLKRALAIAGDFFEALHDLGLVYSRLGRPLDAINYFQKSLNLRPNAFIVHFNIGRSLEDLGRYQESIGHYDRALDIKQDFVEAWSCKGYVLHVLGFNDEALTSFDKALQNNPQHVDSLLNSGVVLNVLGLHDIALERLTTALKFSPGDVEVLTNIGLTLRELGRLDDAVKVFGKALAKKSDSAVIALNLGSILMDMQKYDESERFLNKALELNSSDYQASYNLGVLNSRKNKVTTALAFFREARDKMKGSGAFDYRAWSNIVFYLNYLSYIAEEAFSEADGFGKSLSRHVQNKFLTWNVGPSSERLKIGFVSGDFREHPVARFFEGLLKHLDRDLFEFYAFPTTTKDDLITQRIRSHFQSWIPIFGMGDQQAAQAIHNLGIHILFDLSGHTGGNRLPVFSFRPAPIQVSWLGYFATTGLPEMDYFVGDPYVSPASENSFFVESIWNLPETSWCFTIPDLDLYVSDSPCRQNGHLTFGSFANLNKINEDVISVWARVLQENPGSKMLIKAASLQDINARKTLEGQFAARGIGEKRLILESSSPYVEYMKAYSRVDVVLDTFPYPGGTTSLEAMWMGVPVLTMAGSNYRSRRGYSINLNAGLSDWVASDEANYVKRASRLTENPEELESLRKELRQLVNASPLFDQARFAGCFRDMLLAMWRRYQKSQ
jgi:protein O-GlcNAc transferase